VATGFQKKQCADKTYRQPFAAGLCRSDQRSRRWRSIIRSSTRASRP
jgi:hypothetical protein